MRLALAVAAVSAIAISQAVAQTPAPAPEAAPAAAPAPAPAAAPAPAPAPAPVELPALPTSGDGQQINGLLDQYCVPMSGGQKLDDIAKAQGLKKTKGKYVVTLGAKPYSVMIEEPNPGVCQLTIDYAIGQTQPIVDGLNAWGAHRTPLMALYRNDEYPGADGIKRRTFSWESNVDGVRTGLVFVSMHKTDGSSIRRDADEATLLYSVTKGQ